MSKFAGQCKRPESLSITHKFYSNRCAQRDVSEARTPIIQALRGALPTAAVKHLAVSAPET